MRLYLDPLPASVDAGAWVPCRAFFADIFGEKPQTDVVLSSGDTPLGVEIVQCQGERPRIEVRPAATRDARVPPCVMIHGSTGEARFEFRVDPGSAVAEASFHVRLSAPEPDGITARAGVHTVISLPLTMSIAERSPTPPRDAMAVMCRPYIFTGLGRPLLLAEPAAGSSQTPCRVWNAGAFLLEHLLAESMGVLHSRRRVVELGSGSGFLGIACDLALRSRRAEAGELWPDHRIVVTDLSEALPAMSQNLLLNGCSDGGPVEAAELEWGVSDLSAFEAPVDAVLMADIVYMPETYGALAETIAGLCGPDTLVLHGYCARPFACAKVDFFALLSERHGFQHEEVLRRDDLRVFRHFPPAVAVGDMASQGPPP